MKFHPPALALLALCALLLGTTAPLHADDSKPSLYIALFTVLPRAGDKPQDLELVKVIDLLSGSNNAASVELPQAFVDQAKRQVEADHVQPRVVDGKSTTLTSFLYSPGAETTDRPGISFRALSGVMSGTTEFDLLGERAAVSLFVTGFRGSSYFVSYYAVGSQPKATKAQREALIDAEAQRNSANVRAVTLSRKDLSTDSQTILAFAAITTDGLPADEARSFDRLFEAFRFR